MEPETNTTYTARLRQKGQVTLPKEVQKALHVKEGDTIRFNIHADGVVTMEGLAEIPADQRWFWTPEWQAGEREAEEQIAAGGGKVFHDLDDMFDYLNRER
ncbi:AbrB/MazE/SpoVT family DNA-binding domain-containing protein [Glycomyces paridis]|uniref:AbrB/MazE/SpoVT family DNA-binding domain-containing protein n=1 Tax=Glycomyces paridis TaxID=2126555 RepID=A0A4S8PLQ8_9ACTN|nr:AbrB/MazE/SpoVT family DNA-binding domain-containing protein [Glycomyces paridis]